MQETDQIQHTLEYNKVIDKKTQIILSIFKTNEIYITKIKNLRLEELKKISESLGIRIPGIIQKQELIFLILKSISECKIKIIGQGIIEILSDGFGFLRSIESNYVAGADDIYVSPNQIKRFNLKTGDHVEGDVRPPKNSNGEKYFSIIKINKVNLFEVRKNGNYIHFDNLTPIFPTEKINLEIEDPKKNTITGRIIDLMVPIGKGQRSLIVAPPRSGKTMLIKSIVQSISKNHPEILIVMLLIGERPEEVTEIKRLVKGEVISSTFDEPASRHIQIAELTIEKAKRMVEKGKNVAIFLDSITRLARAYNSSVPSSGKVLTGGVDSNALQIPKKFFGAARNIEGGGSLTIVASALIETGSRMDEVIFEEFKGTGNSEIVLDRRISEKRIYPAIDVNKSGTRREELLLDETSLNKIWILRKILSSMTQVEQIEFLISKLKLTKNNQDFFNTMNTRK